MKQVDILQFPRQDPRYSVTKPSSEIQDSSTTLPQGHVSISVLAKRYGMSRSAIYALIKSDPTFPFKNVGLKKKYVVDCEAFERWSSERTTREKNELFSIPSATELLERYGK